MSEFRFEQLSAFLDGSLDAQMASKITEALKTDAELARQVAEMRRADALLREAMNAALAAKPYDGVIPLAPPRVVDRSWQKVALLAASLVVALAVGLSLPLMRRDGAGTGLTSQAAAFVHSLNVARSGVPIATREGTLTVRLSFVARSGSYCREYAVVSAAGETDGVACRTASSWRIEGQTRTRRQAATGYKVAAGSDAMDAVVDRLGVAKVLDANAEAAAIANGWRLH